MTNEKCQQLYMNLLATNNQTPAYIREFLQTETCDDVFDLSNERQLLKQFIGPASIERITNYKEEEKDKRIARQAIIHYSYEHKNKLFYGLSFKNKVLYYLGFVPSHW